MIFNLNGIQLGVGGYQLMFPIAGMDKPRIRSNSDVFSGRDGGYMSAQYYEPREITLKGVYISNTCAGAETLRSNLINGLPIRQSLNLFITSYSGKKYYIEVFLIDLKMDITDMKSGLYQISLYAPDPYLYNAGDGVDPNSGYVTSPIYKEVPGGYVTPYSLPVQWIAGVSSEMVNNTGDIDISPEIMLNGQFTNPKITNITTGKFIKLNMTTTAGDLIKIDMKNHEITLNGSSVAGNKTTDSTWWKLVKGMNQISLITDSSTDALSGLMRWREAYQGA